MNLVHPVAAVAELIGEPARAAMLIALSDGRALPAGDLARLADVSAQSASGHLSKLVDGGLLEATSEGRHRYYRMTGPEVAHALEALGAISTRGRAPSTVPADDRPLRMLRSCYDHLAGRVAVDLARGLEARGVIRRAGPRAYDLGPDGARWFAGLGVDTDAVRGSRRPFARPCLDWTERRPHLAGALGAALLTRTLELGWFARMRGTRALRITERGERQLDGFGRSGVIQVLDRRRPRS
jgi:DNA-binding transcriptional ArsR family regulator